ncbi:MAG: hypothetical protein HRT35_02610 [Algicola sp.]|nr:hypothetical protein [Algicola sp.]
MKKSILASIFAGLFAVSALAADDARMVKVEVKKETGSPIVIDINNDGDVQVFEFTEEESKDQDLIENRLAGVDEKTRKMVMQALSGIHSGHGNMVWVDDEMDGDDKKKFIIIKDINTIDGDFDHDVMIDIDGASGVSGLHKVIKHKMSKHFNIKIGDVGHGMKLHHDSGHAAKLIQKLLENSELTQEQLDQLQQALDAKR